MNNKSQDVLTPFPPTRVPRPLGGQTVSPPVDPGVVTQPFRPSVHRLLASARNTLCIHLAVATSERRGGNKGGGGISKTQQAVQVLRVHLEDWLWKNQSVFLIDTICGGSI